MDVVIKPNLTLRAICGWPVLEIAHICAPVGDWKCRGNLCCLCIGQFSLSIEAKFSSFHCTFV